ncbi:unnamed protein product [Peniophora sp. CBMAI 1063]|nr:unnamed protein product [Peniophora sp. CBMAI 1063]
MAGSDSDLAFNPAAYTLAVLDYPGLCPGPRVRSDGTCDSFDGEPSVSAYDDCGSPVQAQDDLCRNYRCCDVSLGDLHALVEHFEEAHVVIIDDPATQQLAFYPDSLVQWTGGVLPAHHGTYETYADYILALTKTHKEYKYEATVATRDILPVSQNTTEELQESVAPTAAAQDITRKLNKETPLSVDSVPSDAGVRISTSPVRVCAGSSLLSKRFPCPEPGCTKSYKQANGLRYHMAHGSCSFIPSRHYEAVQCLLVEKGLSPDARLSENDAQELKREVERRTHPFVCGVDECDRRYKTFGGLRYHCLHSGEHGYGGLRLLASGRHQCLQLLTGRSRETAQAQAQAAAAVVTRAATSGGTRTLPSVARERRSCSS